MSTDANLATTPSRPAPTAVVAVVSQPPAVLTVDEFEALPPDERMLRSNEHPLADGRFWNSGEETRRIHALCENGLLISLEIGQRLLLAKSILGHGVFEGWVDSNMPFSARSCREHMLTARRLGAHPELAKPMARLGLKKARALLAMPKEDLDEFMETGTIAGMSSEDIEGESYRLVVKRLKRRDRELAEKDEQIERERKARIKAEQELSEHLQRAGVLDTGEAAQILAMVNEARERLVGPLVALDVMLKKAASSPHLNANGRAQILAHAEWLRRCGALVALGARNAAGEEVCGQEWVAVLDEQGGAAVPESLKPMFYEDGEGD